ncbi:hypothetical protein I317_04767 [Kwoniella heveanensis CBS 569]|nr:hypothetical protein I317_04767 [Kwoniella heveanensis CBS 569]
MSASSSSPSKAPTTASAPMNIPAGNSPITPDAQPRSADENLSGNSLDDLKTAFGRIRPKEDFENIGKIPCARNSLLYGIAGGAGIGAVRFLGSRRPWVAANWAVGSFIAIAAFQWETCNRARRKELQQMRVIQERYPHRHISKLKKRGDESYGEDGAASASTSSTASSS